jgi:hypothetical protein
MSAFIILNAKQAAVVRDSPLNNPKASLNPIERQGSVFILNTKVLTDPEHQEHREYLAALPQMDSLDPEFPDVIDSE